MKLALLFGLNYEGTPAELGGCIRDVEMTKQLLTQKYGYHDSEIFVLTDHTDTKPTKRNILKYLYSMTVATQRVPVENLWISYSGHGAYVQDLSGDERDGRDEVIVPLDYQEQGVIVDDEIHEALAQIHPYTKTFVCWDCCHSGTGTDLPYQYTLGGEHESPNSKRIRANVVMLSGCRDDQLSSEAWSAQGTVGAMTATLLQTLQATDESGLSWGHMLRQIRQHLVDYGYEQEPQLTSSRKLQVQSRPRF